MKTKKNISLSTFFCLVFLLTGLIYSCKRNDSSEPGKLSSIPKEVLDEICQQCESGEIWLPDKTTIETSENQIVFTAPKGYLYYGFAKDGNLIKWDIKAPPGGSVVVTCDCTNGNDANCKPVGYAGKVWCIMEDGCLSCDRIVKAIQNLEKTEFEILEGGFVNPSLGVGFAQHNDELPYAFEALFHYPEVKEQLDKFMLQFYSDLSELPIVISNEETITAPTGYRFIVLNVYGRALVTLIPEAKEINAPGGYTYTCPCNGTSGKCVTRSRAGFHFCEKHSSEPCNKVCNTMIVTDDIRKVSYVYTFYYF